MMMTVQVAHHVFRSDVVHGLAHHYDFVGIDCSDLPSEYTTLPTTKQDVDRFMTDELELTGRVTFDYPDNETPESLAWAEQLIKDLYPDWTSNE